MKLNYNLYIDESVSQTMVSDYLLLYNVKHESISLYDPIKEGDFFTTDLIESSNNVVILTMLKMKSFLSSYESKKTLLEYLENNKIIVYGAYNDVDAFSEMVRPDMFQKVLLLDQEVKKDCIIVFLDVKIIEDPPFKNIRVYRDAEYFTIYLNTNRVPRVHPLHTVKNKDAKDFFVTTIKHKGRLHREMLHDRMKQRDLINKGTCKFHEHNNRDGWIGETNQSHMHWPDGYPSPDLYTNHYFELIPETLFRDAQYITEKTIKPIASKTPFLFVAEPGHLDYLKKMGFKTFETVINESYDREINLSKRIDMVLDITNDIIKNGSEDFYNACNPILEYNHNLLYELSGKNYVFFDNIMYELLSNIT